MSKKSNKEARKARIEGNRKRRKFSRNKKRLERQEAKLHAPGKDLISTLWRTHCFTQNINELWKLIFIQNWDRFYVSVASLNNFFDFRTNFYIICRFKSFFQSKCLFKENRVSAPFTIKFMKRTILIEFVVRLKWHNIQFLSESNHFPEKFKKFIINLKCCSKKNKKWFDSAKMFSFIIL